MIQVELSNRNVSFQPGEKISGEVTWSQMETTPDSMDIRLIWYTSGKGDTDISIVNSTLVENAGNSGETTFEFAAPKRPYSFAGKLIALTWAIEAVALPQRESERVEFTLSPSGQQIALGVVDDS